MRCFTISLILVVSMASKASDSSVFGTLVDEVFDSIGTGNTVVEYKHYLVTGLTAEDLHKATSTDSPLRDDDNPKIGYAAITALIPGNNKHSIVPNANGKYVFGGVEINQKIVITLPKWEVRTGAKQCLIDQWDAAMIALRKHEDHHRSKYEEIEPNLIAKAKLISPKDTEQEFLVELKKVYKEVQEQIFAYQKNYDKITKRGINEGVVWNPC